MSEKQERKLKMSLSDSTQKFILEKSNVRGVIVHLTQSFRTMLEKHTYSPVMRRFLGEILLSAVLLSETFKLDGRMTIQFQSDGAVKTLVAQINDQGHLRGLAQWNSNASEAELEKGLGEGELIVTIFQNQYDTPMQSIVPLEKRAIADALAFYFNQSEQLPTFLSFAVKEDMASGFLLQVMPEEAHKPHQDWHSLLNIAEHIDARELFYDNNASFLQHYFPEEDIRMFDSKDVRFQCGCSKEKMETAIHAVGQAEANHILNDKSEIVVTCEYCNSEYAFDREAVEAIFRVH